MIPGGCPIDRFQYRDQVARRKVKGLRRFGDLNTGRIGRLVVKYHRQIEDCFAILDGVRDAALGDALVTDGQYTHIANQSGKE